MTELSRRPRVFIGSSSEGLPYAEMLQLGLDHCAEVTVWSQGVFGLSGGTLEDLVKAGGRFDYAVLVLTPDDLTQVRGVVGSSPRDNVIFELGFFMGALGRARTFIVYSRDDNLALPSDLAGVTAATYAKRADNNMQAMLGPACTQIKHAIAFVGVSIAQSDREIAEEQVSQDPAKQEIAQAAIPDDDDANDVVQRLRDSMLGDSERGLSLEEVAELSGYAISTVRVYLGDERRRVLGDKIRVNEDARERALMFVARRRRAAATKDEEEQNGPDEDGIKRLREDMLGDSERGLSIEEVARLTGKAIRTVSVYLSDDRRRAQLADEIRSDEVARSRALALVSKRRRRKG